MGKAAKIAGAVLLVLAAAVALIWLGLRRPDIPFHELEARYVTPRSHFVELPGNVRAHYQEWGRADAPAILLLHGFFANTRTWEPWAQRLSIHYRVIAVDLPGHGLTRGLPGRPARLVDYVGFVHAFADKLGLNRFVLAGNSMGGDLAWRYALAHPERLKALVLVDAAGWPQVEGAGLKKASPALQLAGSPLGRALIRDLDVSSQVRRGLQMAYADPRLATAPMIESYSAFARAPGHRDAVLDLAAEAKSRPAASREILAKLKAPTLVMVGEKDAILPPAFSRQFAEAIPGARLIVYSKTGHLPQEEAADRSAADLNLFLVALEPKKPAAVHVSHTRPAVERRDPGAIIFY